MASLPGIEYGGESGVRSQEGAHHPLTLFKSAAFVHSANSPYGAPNRT